MAPADQEPIGLFSYKIQDFYTEEIKSVISMETKWYEGNSNHSQDFIFSLEKGCDESNKTDEKWSSIFPESMSEVGDVIPGSTPDALSRKFI